MSEEATETTRSASLHVDAANNPTDPHPRTPPLDKYGSVDVRRPIPNGWVHLTGSRDAHRARSMGIEYWQALCEVKHYGRESYPRYRGIVVTAADAARLGPPPPPPSPLTTADAATLYRTTPQSIRRAAVVLGVSPAKQGRRHIWQPADLALIGGAISRGVAATEQLLREEKAALLGRRANPDAVVLWHDEFSRRYPTVNDADGQVASDLHRLNRLAGSGDSRAAGIYRCKNRIVQHFHEAGYATKVEVHTDTLPEKVCYGCDGDGFHWGGNDCWRCDGTGIYLPAKVVQYYCFYFTIGGKDYSWHQPEHLVTWTVESSTTKEMPELSPIREHGFTTGEEIDRALTLLQWFVGHLDTPARPAADSPRSSP